MKLAPSAKSVVRPFSLRLEGEGIAVFWKRLVAGLMEMPFARQELSLKKILSPGERTGVRADNLQLVFASHVGRSGVPVTRPSSLVTRQSGFTMIEIALCLAIIGIALVAIIGVLPMGMNVQKDNREETIVNQDATMFMNAIRNGERGLNDLTNYVYAITNSWVLFNTDGSVNKSGVNGYGYAGAQVNGAPVSFMALTNGANIIGLLSTPEFMDQNGNPVNNAAALQSIASGGYNTFPFYSNHIVAFVRSMSGEAVEKPPQDNPLMQQDAFTYRLISVNAPWASDTNNAINNPALTNSFNWQMAANLHDVRLRFSYPLQPNGSLGAGDHSFRSLVGGQMYTRYFGASPVFGQTLYFYQSQTFTNQP